MYLERFVLPIEQEELMIEDRMKYNGGKKLGYIDNTYPCRLFSQKMLREINFDNITILYGGNGSGKSTLLNLIANKLELKRIAPFNSSTLTLQTGVRRILRTPDLCLFYFIDSIIFLRIFSAQHSFVLTSTQKSVSIKWRMMRKDLYIKYLVTAELSQVMMYLTICLPFERIIMKLQTM